MAAAARGAQAAGTDEARVVGLLPGSTATSAAPAMGLVIPTGLGHLRNGLVASADAVVAIGGGAGTLSEICFARMYGRPIIAFRQPGWSGRVADQRLDGKRDSPIIGVDTVEEAILALSHHLRDGQ